MIKLPDDVLVRHFDERLTRGRVIRYRAEDLDDPAAQSRFKYCVILSLDCSESPIHYAFTTSQTAFFDANPHLAGDTIRIPPGAYGFFARETIVNLREVRQIPREKLRDRILSGELTFEGELNENHMQQLDGILRSSRLIAPRTKTKIVI